MFDVLKALLLGIVEGITEWLPVSSTGHMLLLYPLLGISEQHPFWQMFLVVIQLGAIIAVVVLFFNKLWPFTAPGRRGDSNVLAGFILRDRLILWIKTIISCIPAMAVGLLADDWIDAHLHRSWVIAIMLIVYGVLFIVVEIYNEGRRPSVKRIEDITIPLALAIGCFQALAIIPGTSRSGATILGGILLGMSRGCITRYTFFLAIPTMFGASLLKLIKFEGGFTGGQIGVLAAGMITAFLVSMVVIRFFLQYIRSHDFKAFGIYRIILGVVVLLAFAVYGI